MTEIKPATDEQIKAFEEYELQKMQKSSPYLSTRKEVFIAGWEASRIRAETARNSGEVERFGVLRTGFCTTEVYGPEKYYALKIKFQSLNALHKAHDELIAALATPANSRAEAIRECIAIADTFTCGLCGMDGEVGDALRALLDKEAEYIAVTDNNEFTRDNVEKTTAANTALYEAWLAERSSPSLPLNNNPQPDSRAEAIGARPLEEWHEDDGYAVWWTWQGNDWLGEPSYIGSPICSDWPGYHTHWTPHPTFPAPLRALLQQEGGK